VLLIILFTFDNVARIAVIYFEYQWYLDQTNTICLITTYISAVLRDVSFNLAHWLFANKYWHIAIEMQSLLMN
jgi:hypothetical protein